MGLSRIMVGERGSCVGDSYKLHTLSFHSYRAITDVGALGGVHTLDLYNCNAITDVSALGSVPSMTLENCLKVDVSGLGRRGAQKFEYVAGPFGEEWLGADDDEDEDDEDDDYEQDA
jgi:hypothetical protein